MAPPVKPGVTRHLHIDPYVRVKPENHSESFEGDKRLDRFLEWWDGLPSRKRTKMALDLLVAACCGELSVARQELSAMTDEEDKQAEAALEALLSNMAMDEE
jgi:hypothetical protein